VRRAADLRLGSRVQSRWGSDTPALPAGTKYAPELEASVTSSLRVQVRDTAQETTVRVRVN